MRGTCWDIEGVCFFSFPFPLLASLDADFPNDLSTGFVGLCYQFPGGMGGKALGLKNLLAPLGFPSLPRGGPDRRSSPDESGPEGGGVVCASGTRDKGRRPGNPPPILALLAGSLSLLAQATGESAYAPLERFKSLVDPFLMYFDADAGNTQKRLADTQ